MRELRHELKEGFMNKLSLMTKIRRTWKRKLTDRKGQSTTEYILILAIVVMLASKMKTTIGSLLDSKVSALNTEIQSF